MRENLEICNVEESHKERNKNKSHAAGQTTLSNLFLWRSRRLTKFKNVSGRLSSYSTSSASLLWIYSVTTELRESIDRVVKDENGRVYVLHLKNDTSIIQYNRHISAQQARKTLPFSSFLRFSPICFNFVNSLVLIIGYFRALLHLIQKERTVCPKIISSVWTRR